MLKYAIILIVCLVQTVLAKVDIGSLCFSAFRFFKDQLAESREKIKETELQASDEMLAKLQYLDAISSKKDEDLFFTKFFFSQSAEKGEIGSVFNRQYFSNKKEFEETKNMIEKLKLTVKPLTKLLSTELNSNVQVHEEVMMTANNYAQFMRVFEEASEISKNLSQAMAEAEKQNVKNNILETEAYVYRGLVYYLTSISGSIEQILELGSLIKEKDQESLLASKNFHTEVLKTSEYANKLNKQTFSLFFNHVQLANSFHVIFSVIFQHILKEDYAKFEDLQVEDLTVLRSDLLQVFKVNEELSARLKEIEGDPSIQEEKLVRLWETELSDFHQNFLKELRLNINCTTKHFNTNKIYLLELLKRFESFDSRHKEAIDTAFELLTAMNKKVCLSYDHLVHSIANLAYSKIALVLGAKMNVSTQKEMESFQNI